MLRLYSRLTLKGDITDLYRCPAVAVEDAGEDADAALRTVELQSDNDKTSLTRDEFKRLPSTESYV